MGQTSWWLIVITSFLGYGLNVWGQLSPRAKRFYLQGIGAFLALASIGLIFALHDPWSPVAVVIAIWLIDAALWRYGRIDLQPIWWGFKPTAGRRMGDYDGSMVTKENIKKAMRKHARLGALERKFVAALQEESRTTNSPQALLEQALRENPNPSDSEATNRILRLMASSTRPLPARYCGGDFMIPNNPLSEIEQYELAGGVVRSMEIINDPKFQDLISDPGIRSRILFLGESVALATALSSRIASVDEGERVVGLIRNICDRDGLITAYPLYFQYCSNFAFNTVKA